MVSREPRFCDKCATPNGCVRAKRCALWDTTGRAEYMEVLAHRRPYRSTLPPPEGRERCRTCRRAPVVLDGECGLCWLGSFGGVR